MEAFAHMERDDRRPLATRGNAGAKALAAWLARTAVTPNQISLISIVFALAGAASLMLWPTIAGFVVAAVCVQLRLLCNLLDGMVAIEGGKATATGALYNEFPDRVADSLLLVALGIAAGMLWLGWLCALLAALTAYVRMTGAGLGLAQDFRGPMAKPHRMAVMTLGCLAVAVESALWSTRFSLDAALWLIAAGSALTCATRTRAIVVQLRQPPVQP